MKLFIHHCVKIPYIGKSDLIKWIGVLNFSAIEMDNIDASEIVDIQFVNRAARLLEVSRHKMYVDSQIIGGKPS